MDIYTKIDRLMSEKGIDRKTMCAEAGIVYSTYTSMYNRRSKNIAMTTVVSLAEFFGVPIDYLLKDSIQEIDDATQLNPRAAAENDLYERSEIFHIATQKVPLLGTIAAGEPIFAEQDFECYVMVGAEAQCDYCLRIKGDSMINARIYDGDIVFIRKQADVNDGEIAAVLIDDNATLKRVYKGANYIKLVAENPMYAPIIVSETENKDVRILGKAISFQSNVR